jgi:PTS system beta-glucosides-specific IIC component
MMIGGTLIAPDLIMFVPNNGAGQMTMIYGVFPAILINCSSSVLSVLWQVEKFFKRVIPDTLSMVFVSFLTMFVMVPLSMCALAPIGILFVLGIVTILACVIISAIWEPLVMTGIHVILVSLALTQMVSVRYDSCVLASAGIAQLVTLSIAFGAFLRIKEKKEKGDNLGYAPPGIVGAVRLRLQIYALLRGDGGDRRRSRRPGCEDVWRGGVRRRCEQHS